MLSDLRASQKGDVITRLCSTGESLGRKGVHYEPIKEKSIKESWCSGDSVCTRMYYFLYKRKVASRADLFTTTDTEMLPVCP